MDGQIWKQVVEEGQRQTLKEKKNPHSTVFLVFFILRATRRRRQMDRWRKQKQICQEQNLKTIYDQMNARCPHPLPLYLPLSVSFHPFLSFFFFFNFFSIISLLRYCRAAMLQAKLLT